MQIPLGFSHQITKNMGCKLQKSLYGLNQSSRQWSANPSTTMMSSRYKQSKAVCSLFNQASNTSFTDILVYDGNDLVRIQALKGETA